MIKIPGPGNLAPERYVFTVNLDCLERLQSTIAGCLANDHKEQKRLYEVYYGYCLKTVFRYIYHYDKAVDVVNDGFVKIFRNIDRFQCPQIENLERSFMGWMRAIIVNTAIDYLRRNNFLPEIGALTENVWLEDKSNSSDNALLYKELVKEIKKLPPSYRVVFNMYVIDGFTHQEISHKLGISVGTSKSSLSKARVILQKIVKINDQEVKVCSM